MEGSFWGDGLGWVRFFFLGWEAVGGEMLVVGGIWDGGFVGEGWMRLSLGMG